MSDEKENSDFFGTAKCNSIWACPLCAPKALAKKGTNIACLIEARKKWEGLLPFMVTFTMPHYSEMSCAETYNTLRLAWRMFNRGGNRSHNSQGRANGAWGKFRKEQEVQHIVRTYEFTHGKNGWHPHIHALFWTKPDNFANLLSYETQLEEFFWHCLKHSHLKVVIKSLLTEEHIPAQIIREVLLYNDDFKVGIGARAFQQLLSEIDLDVPADESLNELISRFGQMKARAIYRLREVLRMYNYQEKNSNEQCLWFSRNSDGTTRVVESSYYVVGWNGSDELANLTAKTAAKGHMTMPQLIVAAYEAETAEERDRLLTLYVEYAIATRGTKRICFTPGDNDIIAKWKQTNEYAETFKKNAMDKAKNMHVVFWFTDDEWSRISYEELYGDHHIKDTILELARSPDCQEKIIDYLATFYIYIAKKKVHSATDVINALFSAYYEERLMNNIAETDDCTA